MQSKITSLINAEVQNGNLTSNQASELQNVFANAFSGGGASGAGGPGGPGGAGGGAGGPRPNCGSGDSSSGSSSSSSSSSIVKLVVQLVRRRDLLAKLLKLIQDLRPARRRATPPMVKPPPRTRHWWSITTARLKMIGASRQSALDHYPQNFSTRCARPTVLGQCSANCPDPSAGPEFPPWTRR